MSEDDKRFGCAVKCVLEFIVLMGRTQYPECKRYIDHIEWCCNRLHSEYCEGDCSKRCVIDVIEEDNSDVWFGKS